MELLGPSHTCPLLACRRFPLIRTLCRPSRHLRLSAINAYPRLEISLAQPCRAAANAGILRPEVAKIPREAIGCQERSSRSPTTSPPEEAAALVEGAPSYPTRMAFRIMLKTGLRVSEALALRRVDLRLDQDPPIIVVRADSPGNKARKGREVPVPADLVESLHDLASFHNKDRQRPMLDMSRWRLSQVMKETARELGDRPGHGPTPTPSGTPTAATASCEGIPIPVLQKWLGHQSLKDTQRYVELAGAHHEWVSRL